MIAYDAFAVYGLTLKNFYWGQDSRDPFGDGQKSIAGLFTKVPTVKFISPVNSVAFDYWTVDSTLEMLVQAYNSSNVQIGSYRGGGVWNVGGGQGRISVSRIDHMTVLCREVATGVSYGCGSVALSTLAYEAGTPAYRVTDLGTLGGPDSQAYGISANGLVVGSSRTATGGSQPHAFVSDGVLMQDLRTLGGASSYAYDINAHGTVVGYSNPHGDTVGRAYIYKSGSMKGLGTLGGTTSQANGINDSGYIVGWSETAGNASYHAFVFDRVSMRDIGTLGGTRSEAYGISESGLVVGRSYTTNDTALHAFLHDGVTMRDLGTFGGTESIAHAANDAGFVVGTAQKTGDTTWRAYVYNGVSKKELGTFGGANSVAYGINAGGLVVGEASNANFDREAFLYDGTTMHNLNDLIDPNSEWMIKDARAINDQGQIAANGCNAQLECRALRLDPVRTGLWLSRVSLKQSVIAGCRTVIGTVTLSAPAPTGGVTVALSDNLSAATAPATVRVPAGSLSRNFSVKTVPVSSPESGSVFASFGGLKLGRGITARPMGVGTLTLTPHSVVGGLNASGVASLECVAGPGDILVQLQSSKPSAAAPLIGSTTIPKGVRTANFAVQTRTVTARTPVKITATANGIGKAKTLTVLPPP